MLALLLSSSNTSFHKEVFHAYTLQEFIRDFLQDAESSISIGSQTIFKTVFRHFSSFIGEKYLDSITTKDVDCYRKARAKKVSPVTVNIELRMLRVAFYRTERWKLLNENFYNG